MSTFTHKGSVYEVEGTGPVDEPGFTYELWDLTPGTGGLVGRITVPEGPPGTSLDDIRLSLEREVGVDVLLRWMHLIPELEAHGIAAE